MNEPEPLSEDERETFEKIAATWPDEDAGEVARAVLAADDERRD